MLILDPPVAQRTTQLTDHNNRITQLEQAFGGLGGQIADLQASYDQLSGTMQRNRKARRGTAAAVALATAPMPSAPGRTSYSFNRATYRGQQAMGLSVVHRLNTRSPMALSFGVSHAGGKDTAARVGISGKF